MMLRDQDIAVVLDRFAVPAEPEVDQAPTPEQQTRGNDDLATLGLSERSPARHQRLRQPRTSRDDAEDGAANGERPMRRRSTHIAGKQADQRAERQNRRDAADPPAGWRTRTARSLELPDQQALFG
jgi:hypothetical protein